MCFAFGFVRHCGFGGDIAFEVHLPSRFYRRVCLRFTPVFFPLSGKKRRLAVSCVSIPRVEIAFVRSRSVGAVICLCGFTSGLDVFLWRSRRVTGVRRTGIRGRRRGLCAFLRNHIGSVSLSAGSTLGLRAPNLRQRVFDSLDSLHAAAGLCWCVCAPPSSGYTERPAELQFMVRRVGLYSDAIYTHDRPDSSRPQAARSRVACAERCGCRAQPCLETFSMLRRTASSVA